MKITFYSSSEEILKELGSRMKVARIAMRMTQKEMAEETNLSMRTISNLENGRDVSLTTIIEVLRVLGHLQSLELVLPEQGIRPSQIVSLGKVRERAPRKRKKDPAEHAGWRWGDEQ